MTAGQARPPAPPAPPALRGPGFGSYAADEVAWLLTDLSHAHLEAPVEQREDLIAAGQSHYAESLPVEYQPDEQYYSLFAAALAASAARVATAVGVVTELVLAERGRDVVLVSLARAGTPIGILMRRWARRHGLDLPHYAVSIVRGRGLDALALDFLAGRHEPRSVVFVDGWTGKGAIARELDLAVAVANERLALAPGQGFEPSLAVLADPGHCVSVFGTRDDFLIPSACLNSTVSGLVSRTVLNPRILGPGQYHGAKFYRELSDADVSGLFLDTVTKQFDEVTAAVSRGLADVASSDRRITWQGWRAVEAIRERHGLVDVNLVKPGVGETTRVLLRRVPWQILIDPARDAELGHIRHLAAQRNVELVEVPDLPYSCVGLVRPRGRIDGDGMIPPWLE